MARRASGRSALACGLLAACAWRIHGCGRAFLAAAPQQTAAGGRREAAAAAALLIIAPEAANAYLPTKEDYQRGLAGKAVRDPDEIEEEIRNYKPPPPPEILADTLPGAARQAVKALEPVEGLIRSGDYEGARSILAKNTVRAVGLFISPARVPQKPAGAWSSGECSKKNSPCENSLFTIKTNLQLLEEWCFSNRINFFTTDEREKMMNDIAAGKTKPKKVDIEEPLEFLSEAQAALKELA